MEFGLADLPVCPAALEPRGLALEPEVDGFGATLEMPLAGDLAAEATLELPALRAAGLPAIVAELDLLGD